MNTEAMSGQGEAVDDAVTRRAQARVGAVLRSKWRIDRVLGIGGMAAVYEGTHRNGKRGAIKMLHLELSMDAEARARFLREGYVANNVGHPGAVSVLDDDVAEDGSVFVVMELLEGKTLDAIAESRPGGRLLVGETLRYGEKLLDVLVAAHEKGIVHRDLKPENVFVTRDGTLKVLDFGLARMLEHASAGKMTKTGNAMGTPAFMPPEQALGEWHRVDARSDLWAVGASLYTLLSGRLVHDAPTLNQLLLKAMTAPVPPIRTLMPKLPAAVAEVIDKSLAFRQEERYQNAREMQAAVRKAIAYIDANGEPANVDVLGGPQRPIAADSFAATIPQAKGKSRSVLPLVLGGVVIAAAVGVGIFFFAGKSASSDASSTTNASAPPSAVLTEKPTVSVGAPLPLSTAVPTAVPSATVSAVALPSAAPLPSASASVKKPGGGALPNDFTQFH